MTTLRVKPRNDLSVFADTRSSQIVQMRCSAVRKPSPSEIEAGFVRSRCRASRREMRDAIRPRQVGGRQLGQKGRAEGRLESQAPVRPVLVVVVGVLAHGDNEAYGNRLFEPRFLIRPGGRLVE